MPLDRADVLGAAFPLCLGGNIFGWTIDEQESFQVLDAYTAGGGNFIDTADAYSRWVPGHAGGESETIIGSWMKHRGNRDDIIVATKVGGLTGVGASGIREAIDNSLSRLQTDRIDLYYAHKDDPEVPLDETLGALNDLVRVGKVRAIGACGYTPQRLADALSISDQNHFERYRVVQPLYNLLERDQYEGPLQEICEKEGLSCIPFYGLARGFLTGKYRPGSVAETKRGDFAWTGDWDQRTTDTLAVLDQIASQRNVPVAAVSLAWLKAQPTVRAPIASARTVGQLEELLPMARFELDSDEIAHLTEVAEVRSAD